jgi:hypothetical protein
MTPDPVQRTIWVCPSCERWFKHATETCLASECIADKPALVPVVVVPLASLEAERDRSDRATREAMQWGEVYSADAAGALASDLKGALAERARYRKALEFYAEKNNYDGWAPVECLVADDGEDGGCEYDGGRVAREALSGKQNGGELHGTMRGHD